MSAQWLVRRYNLCLDIWPVCFVFWSLVHNDESVCFRTTTRCQDLVVEQTCLKPLRRFDSFHSTSIQVLSAQVPWCRKNPKAFKSEGSKDAPKPGTFSGTNSFQAVDGLVPLGKLKRSENIQAQLNLNSLHTLIFASKQWTRGSSCVSINMAFLCLWCSWKLKETDWTIWHWSQLVQFWESALFLLHLDQKTFPLWILGTNFWQRFQRFESWFWLIDAKFVQWELGLFSVSYLENLN